MNGSFAVKTAILPDFEIKQFDWPFWITIILFKTVICDFLRCFSSDFDAVFFSVINSNSSVSNSYQIDSELNQNCAKRK